MAHSASASISTVVLEDWPFSSKDHPRHCRDDRSLRTRRRPAHARIAAPAGVAEYTRLPCGSPILDVYDSGEPHPYVFSCLKLPRSHGNNSAFLGAMVLRTRLSGRGPGPCVVPPSAELVLHRPLPASPARGVSSVTSASSDARRSAPAPGPERTSKPPRSPPC